MHYRTVSDILGDQPQPMPMQRELDIQLHLTHASEPATYAAAKGSAT
jgi:hypothetical protein